MSTEATLRDDEPRPGNISICAYCMTVGVFDEDLMIRAPTDEESKSIAEDEKFQSVMEMLKGIRARFKFGDEAA